MKSENVKRRYDGSRRQAQARQLRLDVATAAGKLFIDRGFAATTIGQVADAAHVSTQFIYAAFGSKPGLLKKVIDWALVGDDEPEPMAQRPSILAIQQEPSIAGKCALHARHIRLLAPRVSALLAMLRSAADADPDARAIYLTGEEQRHLGATLLARDLHGAGELREGLSEARAADAIWALSPDILWTSLVTQRGWHPDDFELWYAGQVAAAVLPDEQIPNARTFSKALVDRSPIRGRGN